jgi:hypothetical protein
VGGVKLSGYSLSGNTLLVFTDDPFVPQAAFPEDRFASVAELVAELERKSLSASKVGLVASRKLLLVDDFKKVGVPDLKVGSRD